MLTNNCAKTRKKLQPSEMLSFTQDCLKELKKILTDDKFCKRNFFQSISEKGKTVESPLEIKRKKLIKSIDDVCARLKSPYVSFTTVGTTSAGKSTLVNGLCGKRIAPVHSEETSAGELRIIHQDSSTYSCKITQHHNSVNTIKPIEYTIGDDAYRAMYEEMCSYHALDANAKRNSIAPVFDITTSIKIGKDKEFFGIPGFIGVELLDLPGLKNLNDQANISIIQKRLRYSFPIVCLDYTEPDDVKRKKLISLLEGLLQDNGTAIFVLNRYDARDGNDKIAGLTKVEMFQNEIQQILKLQNTPTVIPMSARVLHIAELLIAGQYESDNDLETTLWGPIRDYIETQDLDDEQYDEIDEFVNKLRRRLRRKEMFLDEEKGKLLELANACSGYNTLQQAIKEKITTSFGSVLIQPTVGKLLVEIKEFCNLVHDQYDVYTLAREDEIEKIEESLGKVDIIIKAVSQEEKKGISDFFDKLLKDLLHILGKGKTSNFETEINKILSQASTQGYAEKFTQRIGDIHRSIGKTIEKNGVDPFTDILRHYCEGEACTVINSEIGKLQKNFPSIPVSEHLKKFFNVLENCKKERDRLQVSYTHKGTGTDDTAKKITSSLMNDFFLCIKLCSISVTKTTLQRKCSELNQAIMLDISKEGKAFFENFKKQIRKEFPHSDNGSTLSWSKRFNNDILDIFVNSIEKRISLALEMSTLNTDFVGDLFANINNDWKNTSTESGSASTTRRVLVEEHSCTDDEYKTETTPDTRETTHYWSVAETSKIWSNKINSQRPLYLEKLVNWSRDVLAKEIENIFLAIHENIQNQKFTLAGCKAKIQDDVQKYDEEWQCLIEDDLPRIEEKHVSIKKEIGGHYE